MKADILVKGTVYDGRRLLPPGTLIAVKDGVYCYVGKAEQADGLLDEHTRIYEVKDGIVLPDFYEGHAHVSSGIDLFRGVNLYGLHTPRQYENAIVDFIKDNPDREYIIGRGFVNGDFGENGPTTELLDQLCKDRYVILDSEDCHSSWVNSKVLHAAEIDENTKDYENGVIVRYKDSRKPTGWLKEKEMDRVKQLLPGYRVEDYKEGILKYQEMALALGIGSTYEPIMNEKRDILLRLKAYQELDQENKLIIKFHTGITMAPEDDIDTVINTVTEFRKQLACYNFEVMGIKVFIDGVIEGHTAFLRESYADQPGDYGSNMWKQEKLNELFVRAAGAGISIHVHAIGDAAVESALEAFGFADKKVGNKHLRNCITHLQVVGEDQIPRFRELGIIAVTNPFWHYKNPAYYDSLEVPYLGKERADREYPLNSFFQQGITVTQASDWPVTYDFNPLVGLEIAVTRKEPGDDNAQPLNENEAVTVEQMLTALTVNGAFQMNSDQQYGSIEIGKRADFIILDRNILESAPKELSHAVILRHYIDGKEVYRKN